MDAINAVKVKFTCFQQVNQELKKQSQNIAYEFSSDEPVSVLEQECSTLPLVLSNTDDTPQKNVAVVVDGGKNMSLDFCGSVLECEGKLQPLTIRGSEHITVKNLTIDWKIPLTAEGTICHMNHKELTLKIDASQFPYQIENRRLFFLGNGEPAILKEGSHTVFHPLTKTVCMKEGDELRLTACQQNPDGTVTFYGDFPVVYPEGAVIVLRHSERVHAGIFVENCKQVKFENVTIHATGGLGILCQFNQDLTFQHVSFAPRTARGRQVVCGHDDGLHLTNNSGRITVEDCYFYGLMDDPINVHGLCARIQEVVDEYTVKGRFVHPQARNFRLFARIGDRFSVIRNSSMHSMGTTVAEQYELLDKETFLLRFSQPIPPETRAGDALENLTNTASFVCRNNFFGSCRARGILVSTPRPVLIEHNLFQSAGSAILIAGDANYWYESGACHDVTIRDNTFSEECLSTPYESCEGIISLCPVVPTPDKNHLFHRNVLIENNTFFPHQVCVLYAFCTEHLKLQNNRIFYCQGIHSGSARSPLFRFHCCRQVTLEQNHIVGAFEQPVYSLEDTDPAEVMEYHS